MEQIGSDDMPPKPDELVVMSWAGGWGQGLLDAVSKPFEALSGIRIRHVTNIGLKLPQSLIDSLEQRRRPPFDLVWCNSVPALRMAEQGHCCPLSEEIAPNLKDLGARARPSQGRLEGVSPFVSPYVVHYVMAYREEAFPHEKPDSWEVMLDPRFKGKVALYPGGNGFYPIAQALGGGSQDGIPNDMAPCWEFLRRLKPQVGHLGYSIGMGELIRRGELDICFRALTNAIAFKDEGLAVSWVAPKEGITDTADALWIPRGVPDDVVFWSQRYINFALSLDVQEKWCRKMGVMPVHKEAQPPEALRTNAVFPKSIDDLSGVLYVPDIVKMRYEAEWENKFNEIFSD
ncbi:MAG TPA: extracellular solute-binding protein [Blastocatellia bacterium]|nr:extracellular solute-binding protein [Blastocatellia bacterium]